MGGVLRDERVRDGENELAARPSERGSDRDDQRCLRDEQLADRQHGTFGGEKRKEGRTYVYFDMRRGLT